MTAERLQLHQLGKRTARAMESRGLYEVLEQRISGRV
jgi:hypothetical protein